MKHELRTEPHYFRHVKTRHPASMVIYANHDGWHDPPLCQEDPIGEIYGREPEEMMAYARLFKAAPALRDACLALDRAGLLGKLESDASGHGDRWDRTKRAVQMVRDALKEAGETCD